MIDLDQIMNSESNFAPLRQMVSDGLRNGEIVPLIQIFQAPMKTRDAFDYMCNNGRIGKVLLKIMPDALRAAVSSLAATLPVLERQKVESSPIGGLGGFAFACRVFCKIHWASLQINTVFPFLAA